MAKIFIIDDDPNALQLLKLAFQARGHQVLTGLDSSQALQQVWAEHPDLVILDVMMPTLGGFEALQILRQAPQTESLPIVMLSSRGEVADRLNALRLGADDYIAKPTELSEIIARVETLMALKGGHAPRRGQVTVCIGVKGGVGATFIAANLATALVTEAGKSTALMDACFQFGGVQTALNLRSSNNLSDLLAYASDLETELVSRVLATHQSGLQALLAPPGLDQMETVEPSHLRAVVGKLRAMFDQVVIDTWPMLDPLTLAMLDEADDILLILTPELSGLRNARLWLDMAEARGYSSSAVHLILNQDGGQPGFSPQDIQRILGHRILCSFSFEPRLVGYSLNRGVPLVLGREGASLGQTFRRLSRWVGRLEPWPAERSAPRS